MIIGLVIFLLSICIGISSYFISQKRRAKRMTALEPLGPIDITNDGKIRVYELTYRVKGTKETMHFRFLEDDYQAGKTEQYRLLDDGNFEEVRFESKDIKI